MSRIVYSLNIESKTGEVEVGVVVGVTIGATIGVTIGVIVGVGVGVGVVGFGLEGTGVITETVVPLPPLRVRSTLKSW
jgi:hypothetical protein